MQTKYINTMRKKNLLFVLGTAWIFCLGACSSPEPIRAQRGELIDAVYASGYLITDDEYVVTARAEGYLLKAEVDEGDSVEAASPLFFLSNEVQAAQLNNAELNYRDARLDVSPNSPQLEQIEAQIAQVEAQLALDRKNYERYQRLVKTQAVSQAEFEKTEFQYKNTQLQLDILKESRADLQKSLKLRLAQEANQVRIQNENNQDYFLASSISGRVLEVYKQEGEFVKKGEAIAKIGGGAIRAKLYIAEEDIKRIKMNQNCLISLNTDPDSTYPAQISKIYPSFDTDEQSYLVEASFAKMPEGLYANSQLQANVVIAKKQNVLYIPNLYLENGNLVKMEDGSKRELKIGLVTEAWSEVLEGLSEDEEIVLPN